MSSPAPSGVPADDVIQVLSQQIGQSAVDLAIMTARALQAEATCRDQAELLEVLTAPSTADRAESDEGTS